MTKRRVFCVLGAVELTASVLMGAELMDAMSGMGLPQIVGLVSDLLGGVDLSMLKDLLFSSVAG